MSQHPAVLALFATSCLLQSLSISCITRQVVNFDPTIPGIYR